MYQENQHLPAMQTLRNRVFPHSDC